VSDQLSEKGERSAVGSQLEKAHPALYRHVVTLLVDTNDLNRIQASEAIGAMGSAGKPAVPVLLKHLDNLAKLPAGQPQGIGLAVADIGALGKIAPDEPVVLQTLLDLTTFQMQDHDDDNAVRAAAVNALRDVGRSQPSRRKQIVPVLVNVAEGSQGDPSERPMCVAALDALGSFGPDAAAAIPALRRIKLSPDMGLRQAAS
jgi:hypothetical protein